jgi:hypothetical protein
MRTLLKEFALNGSVQSVETVLVDMSNRSYKLHPGGREVLEDFGNPSASSPDAPLLWEVLKFDPDGRLVEDIDLDRPLIEQESYRYVYKYDPKGQLIEKVGYREDGSSDSKDVYTYDQQGKKVERVVFSGGGRIAARFQFDEHENFTSEEWYPEDGSIGPRKTHRHEYIETGNNLEQIHYPYPENPGYAYRTVYVRDERGRVREEFHYDVDGSLYEKKSFDETGITKKKVWNTIGSTTYLYDNIGRAVEIHSLAQKGSGSPRAVDDRTVCSYDTQGSLAEMITNGPDGSLIRHTNNVFAYDDHGNWIRKTETVLDNVWRTEPFPAAYETIREFRRTISYFPESIRG